SSPSTARNPGRRVSWYPRASPTAVQKLAAFSVARVNDSVRTRISLWRRRGPAGSRPPAETDVDVGSAGTSAPGICRVRAGTGELARRRAYTPHVAGSCGTDDSSDSSWTDGQRGRSAAGDAAVRRPLRCAVAG